MSSAKAKASNGGCLHDYKVDEELGVLCVLCGFVLTEIKDVSPPFVSPFTFHKLINRNILFLFLSLTFLLDEPRKTFDILMLFLELNTSEMRIFSRFHCIYKY